MPLGPDQLFSQKVRKVFNSIDSRIPTSNCDDDGKVSFIFADEGLDVFEIQEVIDAYRQAGWKKVGYLTSQELGERPGLVEIILWK